MSIEYDNMRTETVSAERVMPGAEIRRIEALHCYDNENGGVDAFCFKVEFDEVGRADSMEVTLSRPAARRFLESALELLAEDEE